MKKFAYYLILPVLLVLLLCLTLPSITLAQFTQPIPGATFAGLFKVVSNVFWLIAAAFALVCFVISGIMFMTAMGDPNKLKIARNSVIFGAIGVAVAILAYGVVAIIGKILS